MGEDAKVTIGLPVYNGENFLRQAIESILGQTYGDLRLVISDNCSTDATPEICHEYAKVDDRIEYHRQERNIGSVPNHNFVFRPGNSVYFKWAAHDDVVMPNFLAETVPLLDADPGATMAHGRTQEIDETGRIRGDFDQNPSLCGATPSQRLLGILWTEYFTEIFGLMRADAVAKTRLHGSFPGSDRSFMAEMLLMGNTVYSSEVIFRRRNHQQAYVMAQKSTKARQAWLDPNVKIGVPPFLIKIYYYLKDINNANMSHAERSKCRALVVKWLLARASEELRRKTTGRDKRDLYARIESYGLVTLRDHLALRGQ